MTSVYFRVAIWASVHAAFSGQNNLRAHNRQERWFDIRLHLDNSRLGLWWMREPRVSKVLEYFYMVVWKAELD